MPATMTPPEALLAEVRRGNRFLLTSHRNPDGDAIGSSLALARILRAMGKSATVWLRDPVPEVYSPLPGAGRIHTGAEPPAGFPASFDLAVALECPSLSRCGLEEQLSTLPILNLDHHLGNEQYGRINWVDSEAPALGEMLARLAHALRVEIDPETATILFLTIVTDTGDFRFGNATPAAFEAAGALVRAGARPDRVARWIHESQSESHLRLLGQMLPTLELAHDGTVASVIVTREMWDRAGARPGDTEGLVDHPRSIRGVEAVAFLRETADGRIKGSLRSRDQIDVQAIASRRGGGGHKNAAGFEADGPIDPLRRQLVEELGKAVRVARENAQ